MEVSYLLAKIFGALYLLFAIGLFINRAYYKKAFEQMTSSPSGAIYGGMFALVIGMLIVSVHNFWNSDWTVLITILGWGALVKGALLLLIPETLMKISRPLLRNLTLIGGFALVLGVVLSYFGFAPCFA